MINVIQRMAKGNRKTINHVLWSIEVQSLQGYTSLKKNLGENNIQEKYRQNRMIRSKGRDCAQICSR